MSAEETGKRRRGRPAIPQDVQRRRLLDAALRVFSDKPYESARVADIVREAGMSSRSFYEFFESKEDIVVEMVHLVMGAFIRKLEALFVETDDPIRRIDLGLEAALDIFSAAALDLNRLGGGAGHRVAEARTYYVRRISAMVVRELTDGYEKGLVAEPPNPAAVELVVTGVEGLGLRYLAEGRGLELKGLHPVLMNLMVRAFVVSPRDPN